MATIIEEITVNSYVGTVFDFLLKPGNLLRVWPSLVNIKSENAIPSGGYSFYWQYRMGGILLSGTGKHTDVALNNWIVVETTGAIFCKITFALRSEGNHTKLFMTVDYKIPIPVLGWLAENTIVKMNEDEVDMILVNIKHLLENEAEYPAETHYSVIKTH